MTTATIGNQIGISNTNKNNVMNNSKQKQLHEVFLELKVKVSGKSMVKKAQKVIDNASEKFDANAKKITASKKMLQCEELNKVTATAQNLRLFLKAHTVCLGDYDVINSHLYISVKQKVNELVDEHELAIRKFLEAAEAAKENDKKSREEGGLGELYNEADYPSEVELRDSFRVQVIVRPLPNFSNMNVQGLDTDTEKSLLSRLNGAISSDVNKMCSDLIKKLLYGKNPDSNPTKNDRPLGNGLYYAIQRIASYEEGVTGKNFKQATIENVLETAEIVENLNALGDPQIAEFAKSLKKMFSVPADDLKEDDKQREQFVLTAEEEMEKIEKAMAGFVV